MKVSIWVKKDDIIKGNITDYYNICPQQTNWPEYFQVTIDSDEFCLLEDKRLDIESFEEDQDNQPFAD